MITTKIENYYNSLLRMSKYCSKFPTAVISTPLFFFLISGGEVCHYIQISHFADLQRYKARSK